MFDDLIKRLVETGFITDKLTLAGGPHRPGKSQSFMGICKLPGTGRLHRRVDIKFYPTCVFSCEVPWCTSCIELSLGGNELLLCLKQKTAESMPSNTPPQVTLDMWCD